MNTVRDQFEYMKKYHGVDCTINGQPYKCVVKEIEDFTSNDLKVVFLDISTATQGDYITIDGVVWLLIQQDNSLHGVYDRFVMKRTKHTINFIINESLYNTVCLFNVGTQSIDSSQYISVIDGKLKVIVSENEYTSQIALNDRFIKFKSAWKVIACTNESNGLINVYAEKDQIGSDDDMVNEIPAGLPTWNISFSTASLEINNESTYQLTPIVKKNDEVVTEGYTVSYSSDNEAVATVDSNGLVTGVSVGNAIITATLVDKSESATISIDIVSNAPPTYQITGDDSILQARTATYEAEKLEGGSVVPSVWSFTLEPDGSFKLSDYATLTVVDDDTCTIENLQMGQYVILKGTCDGVTVEKSIYLKGLW